MAKRRQLKYSTPNIIRTVKGVSNNIKSSIHKVNKETVQKNIQKTTPVVNNQNDFKLSPSKTKKVFIVGGGPSLKNFDFSNFEGYDVIAVNKAIEHVSSAKYFVTMDYTFLSKTALSVQDINDKVEASYFVLNLEGNNIKKIDGTYTDIRYNLKYDKINGFSHIIPSYIRNHQKTGFSTNKNEFAHGSNSGYCALQLAILAGYEEIYLLGFDLNIESKITHFHNDYKQSISTFRRNINNYKSIFLTSLNLLKATNIVSCTKESSLNEVLEYTPFYQALKIKIPEERMTREVSYASDLRSLMVVGYYTIGTPYELEAQKLIKSLDKLNLLYDIVGVTNLGNWQANTRFKAEFMSNMLDKHKDKNLLYVDVDAVVHKRPELFVNYNCDVAVRWQDFRWRKNECLSGTIYMENNDKTRKLCKLWASINKSEGSKANTFEQWNLGSAIEKMQKEDGLISKNLPPEYTFIFDSMRRIYPNASPVIEHFQASRRLRNKV